VGGAGTGSGPSLRPVRSSPVSRAAPERVTVLGAGIVGLSSALALVTRARRPPAVTVVADRFLTETTSAGSGGFWMPYALNDTPAADIERWGSASFERFAELHRSPDVDAAGVSLVEVRGVGDDPPPSWAGSVPNYRALSARDLALMGLGEHSAGFAYTSFVADQERHLRWLTERCREHGVEFERRRVGSLAELSGVAGGGVVVNCSGLGARDLFGDRDVVPIRGQTVRVDAPWVTGVWQADGGATYVIPQRDSVVLGGTRQVGEALEASRDADVADVLERTSRLLPGLARAPVLRAWAGLRPGRSRVRVAAESVPVPGAPALRVAHNYGHGGAGVTLAWGCAMDVLEMFEGMAQ